VPAFRLDEDAGGLLLRAPRGALRVDRTVADVFEHGASPRAGQLLGQVTGRLLERLGAVEGDDAEPARPPAPESGPRVSVVIATHQARDLLVACLRSLQAQDYADLELVVVDGGSTDGTAAAVRELAPGAVIETLAGNPGFAAACNAGARAASGELILLLNNDTTLPPDAVGQLVRVAQEHAGGLGAVCAMTRRTDLPAVVETLGNVAGMRGFGAGRYAGYIDVGQFAGQGELFSASFTAVLVPRAAWEQVGPLDERYGYYYEDVDWSLRARMLGLRIWPAPHALVFHEGSASMGARPGAYKERLVMRNRVLWAGKNLQPRNAVGFTRRYAAEDARAALRDLRRGSLRGTVVAAGAWSAAALALPSLLSARRVLHDHHRVPDEQLFRAAAVEEPFMDGAYPRLDEAALRAHYLHLPALRPRRPEAARPAARRGEGSSGRAAS
jgi:N-acetylglucosaminyl-diphospho-decaprenol L-rhamnosyltransferase